MEVDFDAGVEPALVRRGAKRVSAMWEERAGQTDIGVCRDTAGKCCDCDAVETLSWFSTVGGTRTEQECEMFRRRREDQKSSMQTVTSTTTFHRVKRDETQLRVLTPEYDDAMLVPEHNAGTHTNVAISYQQSDVEVSYTSTGVMRYVICVLPCLARERRANEASERSQTE